MKIQRFFIFALVSIFLINLVFAQTEISYFYGDGCPHCANIAESGILEKVNNTQGIQVEKYEIYHNNENREKFYNSIELVGLQNSEAGIPFAFVNCSGKYAYLMGDKPIINNLNEITSNCKSIKKSGNISPTNPHANKLTLGSIILASLIDSINPCAFGVLIFLMISLLKLGSSKRALKAGLVYTFVVFLVYFLSGLGLFKAIQSITGITKFIYLGAGILVLIIGVLQLIDFIRKDKESIIKISNKVKPTIERFIQKGTIPAMIVLGVIVSLFELPCTGGIYLAILSMMSINKTFGIGYLLLYNFIFVLPLILITILIYKGTDPKKLQKWTEHEKGWMKLSSGIVMLILGIYIIISMV